MNIKIETDKNEILDNGSILVNVNEPLYFKLYDGTMNFKIIFEIMEPESDPLIERHIIKEENIYQLKIKFPRRDGYITSTIIPMHLANKDGKKIFLKFKFKFNDLKDAGVTEKENVFEDMVFNYTWLKNK